MKNISFEVSYEKFFHMRNQHGQFYSNKRTASNFKVANAENIPKLCSVIL